MTIKFFEKFLLTDDEDIGAPSPVKKRRLSENGCDSSVECIENGDVDRSNSHDQKDDFDIKISRKEDKAETSFDSNPLKQFQPESGNYSGMNDSSTRNDQMIVENDGEQLAEQEKFSYENHQTDQFAPNTPTTLIDECKSIVDKYAQALNLNGCARSSLEAAMFELMEATQKTSHSLENQFESQRLESNQLISTLRTKSHEMRREIENLKMKSNLLEHKNKLLLAGTSKYAETLEDLYPKHANLLVDLKVAKDKHDEITRESNAVSVTNVNLRLELIQLKYQLSNSERPNDNERLLNATIKELQEENAEVKRHLANSNEKNVELMAEKKSLKDSHDELTLKLDKLTLENQSKANEIEVLEKKCDALSRETDEQVFKTKLRQWCATCGRPGGRFYCSQLCKYRNYRRLNQLNI